MKKFLKRLGIFLSVIILSVYPLDLMISNGLKHSTLADGEIEIWEDIFTDNVKSDYIICGSSRAWVHIDPKILDRKTGRSFYNFGMDAHNFYLQNFRLQEYMKQVHTPKGIIYSLDMFTLDKRVDLYNSVQFLPYMLWDKDFRDATAGFQGFDQSDYFVPMLRYVGNFSAIKSGIKYYARPDERFRYKGYRGNNLEWSTDFDKAKEDMTYFTAHLDSASVKMFTNFLEQCQTNEIPIVFVYTPEYIEGQQFISNREYIIDIYKGLSHKYNIPFMDYSNDSLSYDKSNFYNSLHMNIKGSSLFSSKLADDLTNKFLPK